MGILTLNEQIFLTAVLKLGAGAYGVTIREAITRLTGRKLVYGTLYNTLDKLARIGYVTAERGEATRERGGPGLRRCCGTIEMREICGQGAGSLWPISPCSGW